MPKIYTLQNGTELTIADNPLGEGGEGTVHEILSPIAFQNSVAKILFPEKRSNERRYKVRYMVDNPPENIRDGNGHNFLIWPQHLLLENNDFVGFVMPIAQGVDLEELCRVKLKPELGTEWQKFHRDNPDSIVLRLILCNNIAKAVNALHATGHYVIGDLKPENIRVKSNGLVSILDLDSCQISEGEQIRFQSKMNTPKYNPPEKVVHQKEFSWDLFIVGVIFYEILCGIHPFTGTTKAPYDNQNTPEQKIQAGLFPFGSKSDFFEVIAPPHFIFKSLPVRVQKLFLRCFDAGISDSDLRPCAAEWLCNLVSRPKIVYFTADRTTIIAGVEVNLSWKVEGADDIEINEGIGKVQDCDTVRVTPNSQRIYRILAKNRFGYDEFQIHITTFPTPVLENLKVPMPEFESRINLDPINITSPRIDLSINWTSLMSSQPVFIEQSNEFKKLRTEHKPQPELLNLSSIYENIKRKISNRF
jgi:serine/threonine protein kinase